MAQITIHGANGDIVEVIEGQLHVLATNESEAEHVSEHDSLFFSWSMVAADIGTGADTALLVRNTSSTLFLHIEDISFSADTASEWDIHFTSEATFTPTGTAVVGVCMNRAAPKVAEATAIADETANTQGNIIWSNQLAADVIHNVHYGGSLILGNNQQIAIDVTANTTGVNCNITGYYKKT